MLDPLGDGAKRQSSHFVDGFFLRGSVNQSAANLKDFGYPASVLFAVKFNGQCQLHWFQRVSYTAKSINHTELLRDCQGMTQDARSQGPAIIGLPHAAREALSRNAGYEVADARDHDLNLLNLVFAIVAMRSVVP